MSLKDNFHQALREVLHKDGIIGNKPAADEKEKKKTELDSYLEPAPKERFEEAGVSGFAGIVGSETSTDKVSTLRKLRAAYPDEDFYFVSDSVGDMGEALEAGVTHILAVSYGWGLKEDLKESGAHAVFDSVEELNAFLQSVP